MDQPNKRNKGFCHAIPRIDMMYPMRDASVDDVENLIKLEVKLGRKKNLGSYSNAICVMSRSVAYPTWRKQVRVLHNKNGLLKSATIGYFDKGWQKGVKDRAELFSRPKQSSPFRKTCFCGCRRPFAVRIRVWKLDFDVNQR
ncbi:hypothetical protein EDC96DRAFT_549588 [Choanephora cucurbitarum]|nr:hypothetical protein EDC96DRAFT_549588 [Choanephora cucurbitarum]